MDLITLAQAAQNGDGVLDRRLIDHDGLKAALEGRVFFDVFAEFVQRGGTDAVQFPAGEHGLQQVAGVHGPLGFARADDGVQLVDEEHDLALGALDFFQDRFQPFFELAAELGTGDQRSHV